MLTRWPRKYGFVLAAFCLAAGLFLFCRASALHRPPSRPTPWDSGWYANIWVHGYSYDATVTTQQNVAFFPLYPMLCYLADKALHFEYPANTMLLVSASLSLGSVIFLFKLLYPIFGNIVAARASALFVLNPFAIYLFNGYSEAAWVLCIILFFYFLVVKDNPYAAALCVAAGSTSRPYGIILLAILIFDLCYRYFTKNGLKVAANAREIRNAAVSMPLSFLGLALYTTYAAEQFGDPWAFQHSMAGWGVTSQFHIDFIAFFTLKNVFYNLLHPYWGEFPHARVPLFLLHPFAIAAIFFLAIPSLLLVYRKRIPATFLFFAGFFMAFYYARGYEAPWLMMNMGRYLMICFPFAIALALACGRRNESTTLPSGATIAEKGESLKAGFTQVFTWRFAAVLLAFAALFAKYTYEYYCFRWIS